MIQATIGVDYDGKTNITFEAALRMIHKNMDCHDDWELELMLELFPELGDDEDAAYVVWPKGKRVGEIS